MIAAAVCNELKGRLAQTVRDWIARYPACLKIRFPTRQPDTGSISAGLRTGVNVSRQ